MAFYPNASWGASDGQRLLEGLQRGQKCLCGRHAGEVSTTPRRHGRVGGSEEAKGLPQYQEVPRNGKAPKEGALLLTFAQLSKEGAKTKPKK